ncbi:Asp-tRNA(Asn)/Glu-tRNA(Gln) amidotransferase subunit GatC [Candidatus Woesebacteria bacterium]|nr:Asp-tRNA(Asn)/Glu-tRNA(Gln) amidotransferase subunit GatC [Candidatus Woesebacteria bacterium]
MSKSATLSKDDVLHIAQLANIQLSEDEVVKYQKQLIETIQYVENLEELDTSGVEPTLHSTKASNVYFADGTTNERKFTQDEALKNGKSTKKHMFAVKRLM